jgi:hypothetical protein
MSPGSQKILQRRHGDGTEHSATIGASQQPFLLRMEQQLYSPGSSRGGGPSSGGGAPGALAPPAAARAPASPLPAHAPAVPAAATFHPKPPADAVSAFPFRPAITARAARRKPRSVDELSDGERLRREHKLAEARAAKDAKELEGVTFRPKLSAGTASGAYAEVRPRLLEVRTAPDAYLAGVAEKHRRLEVKRMWAEREKEVGLVLVGLGWLLDHGGLWCLQSK